VHAAVAVHAACSRESEMGPDLGGPALAPTSATPTLEDPVQRR
jgi:hypothetical protein